MELSGLGGLGVAQTCQRGGCGLRSRRPARCSPDRRMPPRRARGPCRPCGGVAGPVLVRELVDAPVDDLHEAGAGRGLDVGVSKTAQLASLISACIPVGILARTLRSRWMRQRWRSAAGNACSTAAIRPLAPSLMTSSGLCSPRFLRSVRKSCQASNDSPVPGARPVKAPVAACRRPAGTPRRHARRAAAVRRVATPSDRVPRTWPGRTRCSRRCPAAPPPSRPQRRCPDRAPLCRARGGQADAAGTAGHGGVRAAQVERCYASLKMRTKASLTMSTDRPRFGGRDDAAMFMVTGLGRHGDAGSRAQSSRDQT